QLAFNVVLDRRYPEAYDPEFYVRLEILKARMRENRDAQFLLLIGSSRTVMSFIPEKLPPLAAKTAEKVVPFNFSHLGAGPAMNLVVLRRLLASGIKPDWLV